ncbi:MAG: hypothetical protein U1E67_16025 [Hyphomicrobiales bacterium]
MADPAYTVANDAMLVYFLSAMEVRVNWLKEREAAPGVKALNTAELSLLDSLASDIASLTKPEANSLTRDAAWTKAYRIERMMALLEPPDTLIDELRRRVDQCKRDGVAAEPRLRGTLDAISVRASDTSKETPEVKPAEVPALRNFLLEVLEENHWTNQRKYHSQPILKDATRRIVWIGLIAFGAFLLPYLYLYVASIIGYDISVARWAGLPLYTALTAGLFGAFFSRLLYLQSDGAKLSMDELRSAREFSSIALRGCVGMCGALVVFFFLQSGIVKGSLFPDFGKIGLAQGTVLLTDGDTTNVLRSLLPKQDLALLVVWCFLAGFSERLVPSILTSTETTLGDAARGQKKAG